MSDVLQGGSTVFISAGKGVITKPKKVSCFNSNSACNECLLVDEKVA